MVGLSSKGFVRDKRNIQTSPGDGSVVTQNCPLKASKSVVYKISGILKLMGKQRG